MSLMHMKSGQPKMPTNKPLKFVPATKGVASTGLANARRLAGRYTPMNKFGVSFTNQIDAIGIRDGECILSIIQADPLSPELTVLLQQKLNHYLQYILDGQLHEERPETSNIPKTIELYLQHSASDVAEAFLKKVKPYIESEGIKFTLIHSA
jgi:hypothetical protein